MACHEIAALRLGLMNVIGIDDESEKQHEIDEIGDALNQEGPIQTLSKGGSLAELKTAFNISIADLEEKLAKMNADDPQKAYYQTLLVTTKKVELDLGNLFNSTQRFYSDLDEMHDFIHEVYPN